MTHERPIDIARRIVRRAFLRVDRLETRDLLSGGTTTSGATVVPLPNLDVPAPIVAPPEIPFGGYEGLPVPMPGEFMGPPKPPLIGPPPPAWIKPKPAGRSDSMMLPKSVLPGWAQTGVTPPGIKNLGPILQNIPVPWMPMGPLPAPRPIQPVVPVKPAPAKPAPANAVVPFVPANPLPAPPKPVLTSPKPAPAPVPGKPISISL